MSALDANTIGTRRVDALEVLRVAARIASPYHQEDIARHDPVMLHAVATLLEKQKVSFLPIAGRYGDAIEHTALADFVRRDAERHRVQRDEFERVRLRLSEARVETMLFKSTGAPPAFHYLSSNLDVLVPSGQAQTARECLQQLGYVELLNVEEPQKFLFRRFTGDAPSFAFHLHEVVGWGVPFLDNAVIWAHGRCVTGDPGIVIPGPSEALLVTLAHWFYEDKALSLGNLFLTAHALRGMDCALAEPANHARRRGWEEGFWGALSIFDEAWKRFFGEGFLSGDQHAELDRAPVRYAAVRARLLPGVRYLEDGVPAQIPFRPAKIVYYRKVMRDTRRGRGRKLLDVFDTLLWAVRWKFHVRSQPALLVSVSGIDGSGKSMQAEQLRAAFETCDVRVRCVWARGASSRGVGAVLRAGKSVLGARERAERDVPTPDTIAQTPRSEAQRFNERQRRLRNPFARWVFSLVYAVDLKLTYVIKVRFLLMTGSVVICDRYVYDALVDFALFTGTDAARPPFALNVMRALVPRPQVAVLLDVDPAEALRRKPEEGGTAHLAAARAMFLELAKSHRLSVVPAGAPAGAVQARLARAALDAFYARYGTLINWLLRSNPDQMNPGPRK
jgi:thymidylate kinase